MKKKKGPDAYAVVTDRIIEALERGTAPWKKPWLTRDHQNLISKKPYRGINAVTTAFAPFDSPYWLTFKQVKELGGSVKAGSKGTPIAYFKMLEKESKEKSGEKERIPLMRYFTVFNVEQCEGIKVPARSEGMEHDKIGAAESIVTGMPQRPMIVHGGNKAFYRPSTDAVQVPTMESFTSIEGYYSTLFHELGHATGHETRIGRKGIKEMNGFGSHEYSKEELVAELTAAFLCAESGITGSVENSAAYCANWLKVLKDDRRLLVGAASQAQKAADFILNRKIEGGDK